MSYARLFYHLVWATKHRQALITDENHPIIYACIVDKAAELMGIVHAIGGMPDHIHVVVTIPPAIPVSRFVGQIKGCSSHLASRSGHDGRCVPFAWQDEYGVISVSERHLPIVNRYVECQKEHHTKNTLNATLERFV